MANNQEIVLSNLCMKRKSLIDIILEIMRNFSWSFLREFSFLELFLPHIEIEREHFLCVHEREHYFF